MASGFMNNIRISLKEGWKSPLQPIIVVHDSNTNLFPISKVFELRKFYDKNYTEYCESIGPRIKLLFDLLSGDSYERSCAMENPEENVIEYEGNAYSLLRIYDKIMSCPDFKATCSMKREEIVPNFITDPIARFLTEQGTCLVKDLSKYKIRFTKLN